MSHAPAKVGDRIRLIDMPDDPDPIPAGTTGTVVMVSDLTMMQAEAGWQIMVKWNTHKPRSLSLCVPPDRFEIIAY